MTSPEPIVPFGRTIEKARFCTVDGVWRDVESVYFYGDDGRRREVSIAQYPTSTLGPN